MEKKKKKHSVVHLSHFINKPVNENRVLITKATCRGSGEPVHKPCCPQTCSRDLEETSSKTACL